MNKEKPKGPNKSKKWTKPRIIILGKSQTKGGPFHETAEDASYYS